MLNSEAAATTSICVAQDEGERRVTKCCAIDIASSHAAERFPGYDFQPCIILVLLLNVIPVFQTVGKIELKKTTISISLYRSNLPVTSSQKLGRGHSNKNYVTHNFKYLLDAMLMRPPLVFGVHVILPASCILRFFISMHHFFSAWESYVDLMFKKFFTDFEP